MERHRGSCPLAASCLAILHSHLITRAGPGLGSTLEMPLSVGMGGSPLRHPCPRPLLGQRPLPESAGATRLEGCGVGVGESLEGGPPPGHVSPPCACPLALRQPARILRAASPSINLVDAESEGEAAANFVCLQPTLFARVSAAPAAGALRPREGESAPPGTAPASAARLHIRPHLAAAGAGGGGGGRPRPSPSPGRGPGGEKGALGSSARDSAGPAVAAHAPAPQPPRSQP